MTTSPQLLKYLRMEDPTKVKDFLAALCPGDTNPARGVITEGELIRFAFRYYQKASKQEVQS